MKVCSSVHGRPFFHAPLPALRSLYAAFFVCALGLTFFASHNALAALALTKDHTDSNEK